MLHGNRSVLHKSPLRFINGRESLLRSNFSKHGMVRNSYEQLSDTAAIPYGHLSGSAWVLPKISGGMSSRNVTTLTASLSGLAVGGITTTGTAAIVIDFAPATGGLIASGNGTASFTISALPLLLTASLNGVGSAAFTISTNTPQLGAEASGIGSALFSFTATLTPYAIGSLSGNTEGGGVLSEASIIAAMNASPPKVNVAKVNDVVVTGTGEIGSEWGPV